MLSRSQVLARLGGAPASPANLADAFGCSLEAMEAVLGQLERLGAASQAAGGWTRVASASAD